MIRNLHVRNFKRVAGTIPTPQRARRLRYESGRPRWATKSRGPLKKVSATLSDGNSVQRDQASAAWANCRSRRARPAGVTDKHALRAQDPGVPPPRAGRFQKVLGSPRH